MSDLSDNSKSTLRRNLQPGVPYKKGDFIGQKYEVYGILGEGGYGIVYLVYSHETDQVFALKTFKDKFLANQRVRERFRREASVWVELGRHPYLVRAYFVDEISGRPYIAMGYIAPNEQRLNSLKDYLERRPPDLAQSLRWAIQICYGMEYAYSKGVRAHRDLKPANIMIAQDATAKITDFGLAAVVSEFPTMDAVGPIDQLERSDLFGWTRSGTVFGTPAYMAPEQFDNFAGCDERSDIYSFGIVLYQTATGGQVPFLVSTVENFWQEMRRLHRESSVPRLDSPLFPVIQRCLEKSPERRYQAFNKARSDLESLLQHETGEVISPPQSKGLEVGEWTNKGASLGNLGRNEEAIRCFDKALELDPQDARAWNNRGNCLRLLGRHEEAIRCFDTAIELDPQNAAAWMNKGTALGSLDRLDDAICCFDKAIELDPRDPVTWANKGGYFGRLGRNDEAIHCFDKAVELDPRFVGVWANKGTTLDDLGRHEEAICCYDRVLQLDPLYADALIIKALAEEKIGQFREASCCYHQFLALATAWDVERIEYAHKRLRELGG